MMCVGKRSVPALLFHLEQKYQTVSELAHQTELSRRDVIIYFDLFCSYFAGKLVLLKLLHLYFNKSC